VTYNSVIADKTVAVDTKIFVDFGFSTKSAVASGAYALVELKNLKKVTSECAVTAGGSTCEWTDNSIVKVYLTASTSPVAVKFRVQV
jgi:hypothetical protein